MQVDWNFIIQLIAIINTIILFGVAYLISSFNRVLQELKSSDKEIKECLTSLKIRVNVLETVNKERSGSLEKLIKKVGEMNDTIIKKIAIYDAKLEDLKPIFDVILSMRNEEKNSKTK